MEILIITILALLLIVNTLHLLVNYNIEKWLAILCNIEPEKNIDEKPKATDNFQKPKEIYQSTSQIIVPKTPTEIRNQNFEKIKEGIEYGSTR